MLEKERDNAATECGTTKVQGPRASLKEVRDKVPSSAVNKAAQRLGLGSEWNDTQLLKYEPISILG